jgi:hypothetical protein
MSEEPNFFGRKRLAIFGTGTMALHYTNPAFYEKVECFFDIATRKEPLFSKPVFSIDEVAGKDLYVLVNAEWRQYKEYADILKSHGLEEKIHFTSLEDYCFQTDTSCEILAHWESTEAEGLFTASSAEAIWKDRTELMAQYISPAVRSVAEFGCGECRLKKFLPNTVKYTGIDYIKRAEDTIVCNANKDLLPSLDADCIFMAGFFEYMEKPDEFMEYIGKLPCKQLVMSYHPLELRTGWGYRYGEYRDLVNFFSTAELICLVQQKTGLLLASTQICRTSPSQVLFDFRR